MLLGIGPHFGDLRSLDWWGTGITLACGPRGRGARRTRDPESRSTPPGSPPAWSPSAGHPWPSTCGSSPSGLVARQTTDWTWLPRTLLAFAVLAVVGLVTTRLIEEPTRRWLATHLRGSGSKAPVAA